MPTMFRLESNKRTRTIILSPQRILTCSKLVNYKSEPSLKNFNDNGDLVEG